MSADNAFYYRQINDKWYALLGVASCERSDKQYLDHGAKFSTKANCLVWASGEDDEYQTEYGIVHDPWEPRWNGPPILDRKRRENISMIDKYKVENLLAIDLRPGGELAISTDDAGLIFIKAGEDYGDHTERTDIINSHSFWPHPIPVSERLPDDIGPVMAWGKADGAESSTWWNVFCFTGGEEWKVVRADLRLSDVTHWLPLPPMPITEPIKEPEQCESK